MKAFNPMKAGLALALILGLGGNAGAQFPGFGGGGGGGGGGRGGNNNAAGSGVMQAAQQVVVVADEYSNSLIVLAPEIYQSAISNLVAQLDIAQMDITELRVFALRNADPTEMAEVLNSLFEDTTATRNTGNTGGRGPGFVFGGRGGGGNNNTGTESERAKLQSRVVAVADPRTSSVIVSASKDLMAQIAPMVEQLDASTSKKQKVFVYSLENADSTEVETVLRSLFESQNTRNTRTGTQNSQQNNALQQRQNNAARNQGTGTTTGFGGGGLGTGAGTGTGTGANR